MVSKWEKRSVPNVKEPEKEATGLEVEVENTGMSAPEMESKERLELAESKDRAISNKEY